MINFTPAIAQQVQQRKVAVVIMDIVNGTGTPSQSDPEYYRSFTFTSLQSVRAFFLEASYGKLQLIGNDNPDGDVFGPVPVPMSATIDYCGRPEYRAQDQAKSWLAQRNVNLDNYDHVVWVFAENSICGGGGNGGVPGREVTLRSLGAMAHELSHNLGIDHANSVECRDAEGLRSSVLTGPRSRCSKREYDDPFDLMGIEWKHMSTFNKVRLKFLAPGTVQTWSGNGVYRIQAIQPALGLNGIYTLKLPRNVSSSPDQHIYLEYRTPYGLFDQFPNNPLVGQGIIARYGVAYDAPYSLATWSQVIDATPLTPSVQDAVWLPGMVFDSPTDGYRFEVIAVTPDYADVRVDRKVDTTAPVLANINAMHATQNSVYFSFTTDDASEASIKLVERGTTTTAVEFNEMGLVYEHGIVASNLKPNTDYDYTITVKNAFGLVATYRAGVQTLATDTALPQSVALPQINHSRDCNARLANATGTAYYDSVQFAEPTTIVIRYGTTTAYGGTLQDTQWQSSHCFGMTGLSPDTLYHYQVTATDQAGNSWISADQTFSTSDTTPPKLYSLKIQPLTATSVLVSWTKQEPARIVIEYGATTQYGSSVTSSDGLSAVVSNLTAGTTYHLRAVATDRASNVWRSPDRTYPDTTPPQIIRFGTSVAKDGSKVIFTWSTNEEATVVIEYGLTTSYGSRSQGVTDTTFLSITGLPAGTYHYRVIATDPADNVSTSVDKTFVIPDTTPPAFFSYNANVATDHRVLFTWVRPEPCSVVVEYGTTTAYGAQTAPNSTSSMVFTPVLNPGSYHYRLVATDLAGNVWTSPDRAFVINPP